MVDFQNSFGCPTLLPPLSLDLISQMPQLRGDIDARQLGPCKPHNPRQEAFDDMGC